MHQTSHINWAAQHAVIQLGIGLQASRSRGCVNTYNLLLMQWTTCGSAGETGRWYQHSRAY